MTPEFRQRLMAGEKFPCECCDRHAQVYRRRIHSSVARQLHELYQLGGFESRHFVHASELIPKGSSGAGDIGKAAYWGLIEKMKHVAGDKKSSGYWRLTGLGVMFVKGNAKISQTALVFDDTVLGFEGPEIDIGACMKDKINYKETMEAAE